MIVLFSKNSTKYMYFSCKSYPVQSLWKPAEGDISADLYMGTAFFATKTYIVQVVLLQWMDTISSSMFQQVIMKRVKMMLFQVFSTMLWKIFKFFDNEWEENAEYTVMEVIPHGFTGKVSFFMCVFIIL